MKKITKLVLILSIISNSLPAWCQDIKSGKLIYVFKELREVQYRAGDTTAISNKIFFHPRDTLALDIQTDTVEYLFTKDIVFCNKSRWMSKGFPQVELYDLSKNILFKISTKDELSIRYKMHMYSDWRYNFFKCENPILNISDEKYLGDNLYLSNYSCTTKNNEIYVIEGQYSKRINLNVSLMPPHEENLSVSPVKLKYKINTEMNKLIVGEIELIEFKEVSEDEIINRIHKFIELTNRE